MSSNTPSSPGNFSYPPPGTQLHFNYVDSLMTSWLAFDQDPTDCRLSIWYWPNANPWMIGLNQTAPANGTAILPLNIIENGYLGQLNFNYNALDGSPQKFTGPLFRVDDSPQSWAVTWSQGVLGGPTPSTSAGSTIPTSASVFTSIASPAIITIFKTPASVVYRSATSSALPVSKSESVRLSSATSSALPVSKPESVILSSATSSLSTSKSPATSGSHLGTGAIVEIVVGIAILAGLAAALVFYRRRKPVNVQAKVRAPSPVEFRLPVPRNFVGEKDGAPLRPKELSGDGQILEMAT